MKEGGIYRVTLLNYSYYIFIKYEYFEIRNFLKFSILNFKFFSTLTNTDATPKARCRVRRPIVGGDWDDDCGGANEQNDKAEHLHATVVAHDFGEWVECRLYIDWTQVLQNSVLPILSTDKNVARFCGFVE